MNWLGSSSDLPEMKTSRLIAVLPTLAAAALLAAGCGSNDERRGGGDGGTPTDAQGVYDTCVERAPYASRAQAEEACAVIRDDYEKCVETGTTNLGTAATPEECVGDLLGP